MIVILLRLFIKAIIRTSPETERRHYGSNRWLALVSSDKGYFKALLGFSVSSYRDTRTEKQKKKIRRSFIHSFIHSVDCDVLTVGEAFENTGLLQISPELLSLGLGHLWYMTWLIWLIWHDAHQRALNHAENSLKVVSLDNAASVMNVRRQR